MGAITRVLLQNWEVVAIATIPIILFGTIKILKIRNRHRVKYKDHIALGIAREEVREVRTKSGEKHQIEKYVLKIIRKKDTVHYKAYSRKLGLEDFEKLKSNLEHIYQEKITAIKAVKRWLRQPEIILYFERFPKQYNLNDEPAPPKWSFQIGRDGRGKRIYQNILKDSGVSLFISGSRGSGKSVAIKSIVRSFFKNNPPHELICADFKVLDHMDLCHEQDACLFNMSDRSERKLFYQYLKKKWQKNLDFKDYLLENNLNPPNWLEFDHPLKPRPLFILGDELEQWSRKVTLKKPPKGATDEELQEYSDNVIKYKIARLLDEIACVSRFMGCVTILASQQSTLSTYEVNLNANFRMMLVSQVNSQASLNLTGNPKTASQKDLKKGKFIYISDKIRKVMIPFTPNNPLPPNYMRKIPQKKGESNE